MRRTFNPERFVTLFTLLVVCIVALIAQAPGMSTGWGNVVVVYGASLAAIGLSVALAGQIVSLRDEIVAAFREAAAASFRRSKSGGWNVPDHVCPGCGLPLNMDTANFLGKDDHFVLIMPECGERWIANGWMLFHAPRTVVKED